jgi:hypothetical protein
MPDATPAVTDDTDNLPAVADDEELDPGWTHERIEFLGDRLAVRRPTPQALAGFSLSSSKYVATEVKNDMTGLFIVQHIGPQSYGHVMQRLMNPDDTDYTVETIGALMRAVVQLRIDVALAEVDAAD